MKIRIIATIVLAMLICVPAAAQGRNKKKVVLTGLVVNRDSIPVSNVIIFLDGKNTNVTTDAKGEFKVKFKPDVEKISFYSVNDGIFEIDYLGQERLEITMNHNASLLPAKAAMEDEAIDAGYGKIRLEEQVGSVASIKGERFENRSYGDVYAMIAGEAAGVIVEGRTIRIRGIASLNGGNDPLLMVDGSPVVSFDHISPNDVASIEILKGSSTAIYGVRGANGVVLVKTKKGGKTKK